MALRPVQFFSRSSPFVLPILPTALRLTTTSRQWLTSRELVDSIGPSTSRFPSLLADIWESVLRAVPKKKTSHMKKRHRQLAGKALKDVKHLVRCPSCGQEKRAHVLCSNCVKEIKEEWKKTLRE